MDIVSVEKELIWNFVKLSTCSSEDISSVKGVASVSVLIYGYCCSISLSCHFKTITVIVVVTTIKISKSPDGYCNCILSE